MTSPLQNFYRKPEIYTRIPSEGKFYSPEVLTMPDSGELEVFPMTSRDEMIMKNPDALLNGEAVVQVIKSCVPQVIDPTQLIQNDVDALLVAIQSASSGDEMEVKSRCTHCGHENETQLALTSVLEGMETLDASYQFTTEDGLKITIKPFSFKSTVKAGIANFQTVRSLQSISEINDDLQQLQAFNQNFLRMAAMNFELLTDSVASIEGVDPETNEPFKVSNQEEIRMYLENCEASVGQGIEKNIVDINNIGIPKEMTVECSDCKMTYNTTIGFNPVNFSTAS